MSDLQFTIEHNAFAEAVGRAARALPTRALNPVLGGVRLSATAGGALSLAAFDYEVSAEVSAEADVTAAGTTIVSGRLLQAISKALPKKPVVFRAEGTQARIQCGAAECTLPTLNVDDYPELPAAPPDAGEVNPRLLAEAVGQVQPAVHRGDGHNQLKAICLDFGPLGGLTLAATDRYRVAQRTIPWQPTLGDGTPPVQLVVPTRALADVARLGGDLVRLCFDPARPTLLGFRGQNERTTTQLLGEEFPKLSQIFPAEHTAIATIVTADLAEPLARALALDGRDMPRVQMTFEPGAVHMSGGEDGVSGIREDVAIEFDGDPIELWVNPRYLLDGLISSRADKVQLGFTAPKRPILLAPYDGESPQHSGPYAALSGPFTYLLMPTSGNVAGAR